MVYSIDKPHMLGDDIIELRVSYYDVVRKWLVC
jgi:hypothetical protein